MAMSALQRPARKPSMYNVFTTSIAYRPPYDWHRMVGFFAARATPGVEFVDAQVYRRGIEIDGALGTLEVRHDAPGGVLRMTVRGALPGAPRDVLTVGIRRWSGSACTRGRTQ